LSFSDNKTDPEIKNLSEVLARWSELHETRESVQISGISAAASELLTLYAAKTWKKVLLIASNQKEVSGILSLLERNQRTLNALGVSASHLPHISMWGSDRFINPSLSRRQRLDGLFKIHAAEERTITVTTLAGLFQITFDEFLLDQFVTKIEVGQEVDQDDLISQLKRSGYNSTSVVDEEGLFSVRGSLLDVFPPNCGLPLRIEFSGDQIVSIRTFNLEDQKSRDALKFTKLGPANEILIEDHDRKQAAQRLHEHLIALENVPTPDKDGFRGAFLTNSRPPGWDLLGPLLRAKNSYGFNLISGGACVIFPKSIDVAIAGYDELLQNFCEAHDRDLAAGRVTVDPSFHFPSPADLLEKIRDRHTILEIGNPIARPLFNQIQISPDHDFEAVNSTGSATARFDSWAQAISNLVRIDNSRVCILASSAEQEERISTLFSHRDLNISRKHSSLIDILENGDYGTIHVIEGFLSSWQWISQSRTLIIPEHVIFGVAQKKQKSSSTRLKNFLSSFRDLKVGDLVVHVIHGVGRYRGMINLTVGGVTGDFLHIEYAGTDKIYLPVDKLNLLQRYSSGGEGSTNPALDKLGSSHWERKKQQVKQAVKEMAEKLLKMQAQRALAHIHIFNPPSDDYFKFEAEFPYEETADQLKAIEEVNADLQSSKAMDRLICGDVGFGKTEVALRAAFRVASEGFQVLVLVPTTILCYQHYRTFTDRLARHGLRIAQINRFVPAKTQRQVLDDLSAGKVDVLVGTHRLLSEDIKTKRLGLLIVDEEQRFGVAHKEKLKELRAGADILTLTATPIPRTLHMSMLGLRDISIITTPPSNRLGVKTYVAQADESLIKEAIEHEISRGGQVFYLHNRIDDIESTCLWIKSLVPKAAVRFGHGQMKDTDLENTIIDFIENKFNVLVCTTIIESGIDMPNVNTLIVDDADRFGLAQLYQLRGRVGRSSVQAYAYFMTKTPALLTDDARRRLDVLAVHQELGSGFQIASHDLEIRGAGNLLGAEQSGHASQVGLEMYTDLLGEAIAELRGQAIERRKIDTEIKLNVSALLPETYIDNEGTRLQFYKSLFTAERSEELGAIEDEMNDRFGAPPEEARRLFYVARIKLLLSWLGASQISRNNPAGWFEVRFGTLNERQIDRLVKEATSNPKLYRLSPDYKLYVYWDKESFGSSLEDSAESAILMTLLKTLEPLTAGLEPS
jgi:transcription-repair coupling factor (superfamily II helicase)